MSRDFENALDDCLAQLHAGASVEECLVSHPKHAEALRPLLSMASAVQGVSAPRPSSAAFFANQQRMLEAAQAKAAGQQAPRPFIFGWVVPGWLSLGGLLNRPLIRAAMTMAVLILVMALGTASLVTISADSLPGDSLYSIKRMSENVRLSLTVTASARQQLLAEFAQTRQDEVRAVLDSGRLAVVEFQGLLEEIGDGFWLVGGLRVELDASTIVKGQPAVGAMVLVQASSPGDGTLQALRLEVKDELGLPTATVENTDSPTPSPTPLSPTPTWTATQTPTRTPEPTPTATSTASHTPLPTPTQEPEPTDTPAPTNTREPVPTDTPPPIETNAPAPTDEPGPSETDEPKPTETDEPGPSETDEPEPTETDEPEPETDEPESTDEPEPTKTDEPEPPETDEPGEESMPDPKPTDN